MIWYLHIHGVRKCRTRDTFVRSGKPVQDGDGHACDPTRHITGSDAAEWSHAWSNLQLIAQGTDAGFFFEGDGGLGQALASFGDQETRGLSRRGSRG